MARLHAAGISHGRLNLSNVVVVDDAPLLLDFSAATLGAPRSALDIDVAELLVACTVLVGPDRALRAAIDGAGVDVVAGALPYLQRAALTPHVRDLARTHEVALDDLRTAAAEATGEESPEIAAAAQGAPARPAGHGARDRRRLRADHAARRGRLRHDRRRAGKADLAWVALALVLAQLTFVAQGVSLRGAVVTPLPLLPCVVLQSAIKFINLTVPSSAGRIGMNVRFLQRMGASPGEAVAAGAVDDVSETVVQLLIVLLHPPVRRVDVDTSQFELGAPDGRLIAAILVALVAVVAVVLAVPSLHAKVVPAVRNALSSLWVVARTRRKRLELFGGNLAAELLFALTLGAVCRAYGVDLSLAELLLVNTAASAFAGLMPVPGGVGAAEAGLTAGLVGAGRRRIHRLRRRDHPSVVHLLPASLLGVRVVAVAQPQGLRMSAGPRVTRPGAPE